MSVVACESCKGAGKMLALGNIKAKCEPCLGVGYVSQDVSRRTEARAIETSEIEPHEIEKIPQRGRKKKKVA